MKKILVKNISTTLMILVSLFLTNHYLSYSKNKEPEFYSTLSAPFTKVVSFGNYRFISSLTWVKTLLDADTKHVKNNELSWLYHRFNLISELDPSFYENYLQGGIYLSVIKDDIIGARKIYEKGLKLFPNDIPLLFHTAFNYHFELNNYERSLYLFKKIKMLDPDKIKNIDSLITDATLRRSNLDMKKESLIKMYNETNDEELKEAIKEKLKKMRES